GALEGLQIYDGLHDTALTRALLDAIVDDRSVGMLRFCRMPGAEIEAGLDSLVLTGEQSNTSLVFGESAIFKVFRRVNPGPNPDLEVASALAELGSSHIAEPFGWVETRLDGASTVLAILSRYLRAASDGWALAATSGCTATTTWARSCGPRPAGSCSTSRASRPARWPSAGPGPPRCGTWPACCVRSTTPPGTSSSPIRRRPASHSGRPTGSGATATRSAPATRRRAASTRPRTRSCFGPCCSTRPCTRSSTRPGTGRPGFPFR